MTRGRVVTISEDDLGGYNLPDGVSLRANPGVTALMSVSNKRGAYRKRVLANLKLTGSKIGGLPIHKTPPAKHRRKGAVRPEHYAGPGYRYPVRTARRANESVEHWHERDRKLVRRALSYFGQHKHRYSPQVRKIIACNIAKAAKSVGQDSPKAMEYRTSCATDVRKNGGEMALYFRRVSRSKSRRPKLRRNEGLPRFEHEAFSSRGGPTGTKRMYDFEAGPTATYRIPKPKRGLKIGKKAPLLKLGQKRTAAKPASPKPVSKRIGKKSPLLKLAQKRTAAKPAAAPRGSEMAKASKKGSAKKPTRKAAPKAAKGPAKRAPSKHAKKSGSKPQRKHRTASGRMTASLRGRISEGAQKYWKSAEGKKRKAAMKRKAKAASKPKAAKKAASKPKAAKKAASKPKAAKKAASKPKAAKKRSKRSPSGGVYATEMAGFLTNRRRRRGVRRYRRNADMGMISAVVKPVLVGAGGYAVHRIGTTTLSTVLSGIVSPTVAKLFSALAVAVGGGYLVNKFLPKHAFNATIGMGLSTFGLAVKELLPGFANYAGFGDIQSASLLPKYSTGQYYQAAAGDPFLQAAAGDPFLQAAAGEYFTQPQLGEYFSQDIFQVPGSEGNFAMSKIDVKGDTGAYEFHQAFEGVNTSPIDEGISPTSNMDAAFNFMEAAAGVGVGQGAANRSDYIPRERALPAGGRSTNYEEGIFDQGGIFAG